MGSELRETRDGFRKVMTYFPIIEAKKCPLRVSRRRFCHIYVIDNDRARAELPPLDFVAVAKKKGLDLEGSTIYQGWRRCQPPGVGEDRMVHAPMRPRLKDVVHQCDPLFWALPPPYWREEEFWRYMPFDYKGEDSRERWIPPATFWSGIFLAHKGFERIAFRFKDDGEQKTARRGWKFRGAIEKMLSWREELWFRLLRGWQ